MGEAQAVASCLESPDEWADLESDLAAMGVSGNVPLGFLFHRVSGLPETHAVMQTVRLLQKIGTAAKHGDRIAWRDKDGNETDFDNEGGIAIAKIVCDVYGEAPLFEDTSQESGEEERCLTISRKRNGRHWQVTIERSQETGRYTMRKAEIKSPDLVRLQILLGSISIRQESALLAAEETAQKKLKTMVSPEQWASFVLNDSFYEVSKKSGIRYLLRKNRPTIALRGKGNDAHILGALCFHPGGYYECTWIGVLPPSDELIAHLLFIRGAEYLYWKGANVHDISDPLSGV